MQAQSKTLQSLPSHSGVCSRCAVSVRKLQDIQRGEYSRWVHPPWEFTVSKRPTIDILLIIQSWFSLGTLHFSTSSVIIGLECFYSLLVALSIAGWTALWTVDTGAVNQLEPHLCTECPYCKKLPLFISRVAWSVRSLIYLWCYTQTSLQRTWKKVQSNRRSLWESEFERNSHKWNVSMASIYSEPMVHFPQVPFVSIP